MKAEQNDRLFTSIFGSFEDMEEVESMVEIDGKIYKLKGKGTPEVKGDVLYTLVVRKNEVEN